MRRALILNLRPNNYKTALIVRRNRHNFQKIIRNAPSKANTFVGAFFTMTQFCDSKNLQD